MSTSPMLAEPPVGLSPLKEGDPAEIGPYRLVGRIGAGGMGAVYGALDTYGRCVAVKTVRADLAAKPRFREAFAHEVAMLARADGVSTARLYAHDTEAEVPWLAFDHVPGRDLRAHVREFGPLEGEMLRVFALGMAEGLAALHAAGVVHRDVKPANVILSPDGPKIVDFGIAAPIGTERSEDAFADHGSPGWAAPERHTGAVADSAADVFAWGALVAMAATGRQPFGKGETKERIRRVCAGEYEIDGVPEDLLPLVEGTLSMDPRERPSAADLVRALLPEDRRGEEVGRALRRMLGDYWRGVDAAGHDPARWAAWLGGASATALGATGILGGGVGAGTGGAATGGVAGSSAAASGTTGATASGSSSSGAAAGVFGGGSSSGGALGGVAGSKLAMVGAGALAVAGVAAGGYVAYDRLRDPPADVVASAATLLEETGFVATVERTPVGGGETVSEEYLYSADGESFLIRGAAMGPGTTAVAVHQGELYVYASRPNDPTVVWQDSVEPIEVDESVNADSASVDLVTGPMRALAVSGEVERDGEVYTGPTTVHVLSQGAMDEAAAVGRIETDEEGIPLRAEYSTDEWEVEVAFSRVGEDVTVEDPQITSMREGNGWAAVHAPICGSVTGGGPWTGEPARWDVQASAWEVDCDYAMDVSEMMNDTEAYGEEAVAERTETMMTHSGSGGSTWLVDETMACAIFRRDLGGDIANRTFFLSPCIPAERLGEATEESPFFDVDFEARTLIDYHEQG
ncbi:serine/threonine protein kinase [Nocardiopsis alba]|uniref:serine/threonine protein kinase n=1 Tax=Nocardiopsis alba TaxID=53437 RepID=UPI003D75013F